jgi:hypothetical protein
VQISNNTKMKTIYFLLAASFCSFTSCNKRQQTSTSGQPASIQKETRESTVILKENGELRVKPLQGMDLVKDAPQPPVVPVDGQDKGDIKLNLAASTESIKLANSAPKNMTTSQSPIMRATIRTQAMEEMARQKDQASDIKK